MNEATDRLDTLRRLFRSWFELTRDEQKALILVLDPIPPGVDRSLLAPEKEAGRADASYSAQNIRAVEPANSTPLPGESPSPKASTLKVLCVIPIPGHPGHR